MALLFVAQALVLGRMEPRQSFTLTSVARRVPPRGYEPHPGGRSKSRHNVPQPVRGARRACRGAQSVESALNSHRPQKGGLPSSQPPRHCPPRCRHKCRRRPRALAVTSVPSLTAPLPGGRRHSSPPILQVLEPSPSLIPLNRPPRLDVRLALTNRHQRSILPLHEFPHRLGDQERTGTLHLTRQFVKLADNIRVKTHAYDTVTGCSHHKYKLLHFPRAHKSSSARQAGRNSGRLQ